MTVPGLHYATIRVRSDELTAVIEFARPEAENRINRDMITELGHALTALADQATARILILRGDSRSFCGGVDWAGYAGSSGPDVHAFRKLEQVMTMLERLAMPTIAVLEGRCAGAGLDLALACDYRIGTSGCVIDLPEIAAGYLPSMLPYRLPKYIGLGAARRLLLSGGSSTAARAAVIGLIDEVVPAAGLQVALGRLIATFGQADPVAVAMGRRLMVEAYSTIPEEAVGNFLAAQDRCLSADRSRTPAREETS